MSQHVDELINRYLGRIPNALEAHRQDAQYHAEIALMRKILTILDMLMEDEQIPEDKRVRIIRTLIYGGPDEAEALARIEDHAQEAGRRVTWFALADRRPAMSDILDLIDGAIGQRPQKPAALVEDPGRDSGHPRDRDSLDRSRSTRQGGAMGMELTTGAQMPHAPARIDAERRKGQL